MLFTHEKTGAFWDLLEIEATPNTNPHMGTGIVFNKITKRVEVWYDRRLKAFCDLKDPKRPITDFISSMETQLDGLIRGDSNSFFIQLEYWIAVGIMEDPNGN